MITLNRSYKFFILVVSFLLINPQVVKPLTHKQTSLIIGGVVAACAGYGFFKNYKKKNKENKNYSFKKNLIYSSCIGLASGIFCGGGLYMLLNRNHKKSCLVNKGNINGSGSDCFIDASCQALYHSPSFREFIDQTPKGQSATLDLLREHFNIIEKSAEPISISGTENYFRSKICDSLGNSDMKNGQHDAQEFINLVFNKIKEEVAGNCDISGKFKKLFSTTSRIVTKCTSGHSGIPQLEDSGMLQLVLPLQQTNLTRCVEKVQAKEDLLGVEQYDCIGCKKKVDAEKTTTFTSLPRLLILHLSRFNNDLTKNTNDVLLPHELMVAGEKYQSKAVVNHLGGYGNGHYTAYVKGTNDKWYRYDDLSDKNGVPQVDDWQNACKNNGYLVFLEKMAK